MKSFAVDIPAYVTVRFEARDEAHAKEIIAAMGDGDKVCIDLCPGSGDGFDIDEEANHPAQLSPCLTVFSGGSKGAITIVCEDGEGWVTNYYACPGCACEWQDGWECAVDDDCPNCGKRHISPHHTE